MARVQGFSPTLLVLGALAVVGGSAAALLGVGAPHASLGTAGAGITVSLPYAFDVMLALPIVALVGVVVWSMIESGEASVGAKGAIVAVLVVAVVLVGVVWVFHTSILHPVTGTGSLSDGGGGGGHGSGGSGGSGGGGSGRSGGSGGTGKNGTSNGTGSGGGNKSQSGNGTGGSGKGNTTSGGGSNGTGTTHGGTGGNGTAASGASRQPPPPLSAWPAYAACVALSLLVAAMVVPQLASRWANRRRPAELPPPGPVRSSAVTAFVEARKSLEANPTDPRSVIQQLYTTLLHRLEPRVGLAIHRTPEEVRRAHLLPLGVRAEAADQLTRLFEEACYSSHPLGSDALRLARVSVQIAEYDLRAAHAFG